MGRHGYTELEKQKIEHLISIGFTKEDVFKRPRYNH